MRLSLALLLALAGVGCVGLKPTSDNVTARFGTFESIREVFDRIVPGETSADDLRGLRIDPGEPGVQVVPAVRAASYFTQYPEAPRELQPPEVRSCVALGPRCQAWLVSQERIRGRRIGSLLLDVLRFRRLRHTTGWTFDGIIFLEDDVVVHSIWAATPRIDEMDDDVRPLGLLQGGPQVEMRRFRRPRVVFQEIVGKEQER